MLRRPHTKAKVAGTVSIANPDPYPNSLSMHKIEDESEVLELAYQLTEIGEVYGCIALNRGVKQLKESLQERAATMGVLAALVGSMIFQNVVEPPMDLIEGDDDEVFVHIAVLFWAIAVASTVVCMAVCTHHIALLSAFIATDADILRFVIAHVNYIDSPDYLLVVTLIMTLCGLVASSFAIYPIWLSVSIFAINLIAWVSFGLVWRRGFKFFHRRSGINIKKHLQKREYLKQNAENKEQENLIKNE